MQSSEIRSRFLAFFEKRGHAIIPSASLVPENDPSVLFNTAGMQPLVPYLLGQEHPMGRRVADVQKCVRTGDLEDIGDNRHFSFFEMMGNWSLGDYFKKEAISWSYEFLTSKEEGLGLDVNRLYVTIFEGDENAPYDQESKDIWMSLGIPEHRIYALPADDNWWSPGDNGPCGPCSEMFYDMTGTTGDLDKDGFIAACKSEDVIEIWNDVFMEYEKKDGKVIGKLAQKNVDTGAGLERITAVMQGKKTAYETDLFITVMNEVKQIAGDLYNEKDARVIVDHIRTSMMLISDGVTPSNKDQGYVLRRLIRRASIKMRKFFELSLNEKSEASIFYEIVNSIFSIYKNTNYVKKIEDVFRVLVEEELKFRKTLESGLKEFEKGISPFLLATTYGFPIELTEELAQEKGIVIDRVKFDQEMKEHQDKSRSASAGMFKGGLANTNDKTVRLHTAHHLLLAALQQVVSPSIKQRGSNITEERLRMDFSFDRKLTDEEKKQVEDIVNEKIKEDLSVVRREMPLAEAEKIGAEMEFGAKYPDVVSIYFIEDKEGNHISKEFCGGPHVTHTGELGQFKIQKEEAVAQGIRRIKAILE
jgi:alanyl-tRNA synthetase